MIRSIETAERVAAIVIVAFGAWFLWQASELRSGPGYAAVGPRVFPIIVGLGLLGSGAALLVAAFRGRAGGDETPAADDAAPPAIPADWPTLGGMAALLAAYVLLFQPLGFILTSIAFLVAGAWALGSRSPVRDVVAAVLVSLVTYVVFTRLLGLELPGGPLEEPLRELLRR